MRMFGLKILDEREEEAIHQAALHILDEVGVLVESEEIRRRLAEFGGRVDEARGIVKFSPDFVEKFVAESEKFDWERAEPMVGAGAAIFCGYYLDPETDEFRKWTIKDILRYLKVAKNLGLDGRLSYVFPLDGVPPEALVPFFNYLSLKFTGRAIASVNNVKWAPVVLEMCQAYADEAGVPVQDVLSGAHIHLISPLKLGREEAKIFLFFAERGLRIGVGTMCVMGATSPVTLAGSLALHLAQSLFVSILERAFFGERRLHLGSAISPMDMRTMMQCYGRPEKELANVAMAQMARRYGAHFFPHTGHSDAKRPGPEAGFEKALNTIPSLLACGRASINCGLLSVDEVHSPVQMVIDLEIVSALRRFVKGFEVSEETLAFDVTREVGPGGNFTVTDHTARLFRRELWEPRVFAREMMDAWLSGGGKTEVDKAREICLERVFAGEPLRPKISESLEGELLSIIERSTGAKIRPVEPL